MHLITLAEASRNEKTLSQSVLQITQMLGLYHAELARILLLNCADVGELAAGNTCLVKNTPQWMQALKWVQLYERLYAHCRGEEVAMCHWLRRRHDALGDIPLYVMVDEGRIDEVLGLLQANAR